MKEPLTEEKLSDPQERILPGIGFVV